MRYFAYGTNVNEEVFARKRLTFTERCAATLDDYVLRFDKQSQRARLPPEIGFANIVPQPGSRVEGVLYRMADAAQSQLDQVERCPSHYERIDVTVSTADGSLSCVTYRAQPSKRAEGLIPSRNYLNYMLAERQLLSPAYREALQRLETYSSECAACHRTGSVLFHRENEQMFVLCSPCLEAKRVWGEAFGRALSVLETEAVMLYLRQTGRSYDSVWALVEDVIAQGVLGPRDHEGPR